MQDTTLAPSAVSPATPAGIFGSPALRPRVDRPPVHVISTEPGATVPRVLRAVRMKLGPGRATVAEVEIGVSGLRLRLLVRGPLVLWPLVRGEQAVTLESADLTAAVEALAVAAAEGAE